MNIISYIILAAICLDFILELVSNLLNLTSLNTNPPSSLRDVYDSDKYRKSQEYLRENTQFGFVVSAFGLAILLIFWFLGGFNWLDLLVRSWGFGTIVSGLIYTGIIALAYSLIMLPFGIYSTFRIEQRYGFNRTSPVTFITDRLKGLLLGVLLGVPLLAAILALFELTGQFAWLYCWAAVSAYLLIFEFIAPNWIMPLFNKFTPLQTGELRTAIMDYAESVHFPIQNVYVIDGSKRSSKSNAFFTGFGRNKRIALFDTLIAQHTVPELVSVLAHEIGHYKKKHIIQSLIISILHFGLLFYLLSLILKSPELYQSFYMTNASVYTGLIFFGLLYTPVELVISILLNMLSRMNEREADRFAVSTIKEPMALGDALKKLAANNLSNLTPHPFYSFLHYSHPPLSERVLAIRSSIKNTAERS
jgi:STE24 endopeptidase